MTLIYFHFYELYENSEKIFYFFMSFKNYKNDEKKCKIKYKKLFLSGNFNRHINSVQIEDVFHIHIRFINFTILTIKWKDKHSVFAYSNACSECQGGLTLSYLG